MNDCSTDNSLEIINSFANVDERIIVIQNSTKTKNFQRLLNIGHKLAKGDFVTWTSDDNVLKFNFLEEQLKAIEKEKVDIVYSNYNVMMR